MKLPKIVQKKPYISEEKSGKKAFCRCGLSGKDPYCDGSHKGTGFSPEIIELTEDKKVAWCGCKHSKKGAFCDGTHKAL
jgi:CDGSH-type Zn-finger protein